MTVHHIMRESDQKNVCPYCGRKADPLKWESVFDHTNFHYKTHQCECGRRMTIKMSFSGSGHDSWNGVSGVKCLDKRIEEVDSESLKQKQKG
ncbi:hypothetical protein JW898_01465 [Candidatus Woesearchaeota archaeon]|nr:hypothetical protein [Candidatus Woesearchaeota archaeon]